MLHAISLAHFSVTGTSGIAPATWMPRRPRSGGGGLWRGEDQAGVKTAGSNLGMVLSRFAPSHDPADQVNPIASKWH